MGRIRSIKPEFPQSETIGRLSRDARLLFIQLWTLADDSGKARASSRMLASLLYPYDDDAPALIDGWLDELDAAGCIHRYRVDGATYLEITNWLKHQKIDKPSKSKIPDFDEGSRVFVDGSTPDLGSRIKDQGSRIEERKRVGAIAPRPPIKQDSCPPPVAEAVAAYNATAEQTGWPQAQRITAARASSLRKRLSECGGVEGWRNAMAMARASPFLCGDNDRGWKADIDFFLQAKSFTKLMEGGYGGKNRPRGAQNSNSRDDAIITGMARAFELWDGDVAGPADTEIPPGRFELDG